MKKILLGLLTTGAVAGVAMYATNAFFSDTETSNNNTFTAGRVDLKIDSQCSYNGATSSACGNWQSKDLNPLSDKFFNFADVKPGDYGENTISLDIQSNPVWACIDINNLQNKENDRIGPEIAAGDTTDGNQGGELAQNLYFTAWSDSDCNNIYDGSEQLLLSNQFGPASDVLNGRSYALADSVTRPNNPIQPGRGCVGVQWCAGKMTITNHTISCDGSTMGNESQTDSLTADVSFRIEQARNNMNFVCGHRLVLENEVMSTSPDWTPIIDGIQGILTWKGDGPTFDYNLTAHGLPANTPYSLVYYADPFPGNNPGGLIGSGTTDGSGNLAFSGTPNLGFDMPMPTDANKAAHNGAKIWLIPSANYNTGSNSVTPWTPDNTTWLFEGNVYINYNDTDN